MSKHNEIGTNGELQAMNFLKKKEYIILASNWRYGKKEVDIIAKDGKDLVFVEVKTRRSKRFGFPEESVSPAKQRHLKEAAVAYCAQTGYVKSIRFDVISIEWNGAEAPEIRHFHDAFY
ncbi:YraN family protein [Rurimicrobium arvi]|uniref:UPF0102 protein GCM10023092_28560 n=1 Tax=Rurimicrobium arvi TaxID=2049916 RepID=A0ABP8N4K8_9BACT